MKYTWLALTAFFFLYSARVLGQTVSTPRRTVTKLNDHIYFIRHKDAPDGNAQGNTTVIIGDTKVIVVDACYLPSAAKEDIQDIRRWTDKPVDYLINTHWHADHQQGNTEYLKAFPGITIIAHKETAKEMLNFETRDIDRYRQSLQLLKQEIANGKDDQGRVLAKDDISAMRDLASAQDSVAGEFIKYVPAYPNMVITGNIDLDVGNETAHLLYLGPDHTDGDIMLYLPAEKYLVTGDILVYPIPYFFGGGRPYSGLKVLEAMDKMDVSVFIPGHGELLKDKVYLGQEIDLVKYVIAQVESEVYKEGLLGIKIENVRKAIDLTSYRKQFAKDDADSQRFFDQSISKGLVEGCFKWMSK